MKWNKSIFSPSTCTCNTNCRAVAIRFGVVRFAVHAQERYMPGGLGACSPRKILKFRGCEFLLKYWVTPFTGEACKTDHSLVRTGSCWKEDSQKSFVALFAAILQVSTWHLCAWGRIEYKHIPVINALHEWQVLAVRWNDQLIFDICNICQLMKETRTTKQNPISL